MELIRNWWYDLMADRIRILLTIFSVALGTASILLMLALGEGLRLKLFDIMSAGGVDILTMRGGATESEAHGFGKDREIQLTWQDYLNLKQQLADIAAVMPKYRTSTLIEYLDKSSTEDVAGVNNDYFALRHLTVFAGGRSFNDLDQQQSRSVVIIGDKIALNVFGSVDKAVGKSIVISGKSYTVIGVLEPLLIGMGSERSADFTLWLPMASYKAAFNPQAINSLNFKPADPARLEEIKSRIRIAVARAHHTAIEDKGIVNFFDVYTMQQKVNLFMWAMEIFLGLIGGLTLAVAGVGVANIMYLTVKESVKLIGLRMAIGAQPYQILMYYLVQAAIATVMGGLIGALIGYGLIELVGYGLNQQLQQLGVSLIGEVKPISSFFVVKIVVFVLVIVALLAGWFPARHAASMSPAEALR